ncbi:uncharacterized protein LOC21402590 isoform X4 [Morus notabilis]|nr:uncharacterized protein LOC21402590 isoform X4 [Morus notabilis]
MQGPFDDTDHDDHHSHNNTVSSRSENKFSKYYMNHKVRMRGESGACCNVCAAPCSSCMHLNHDLMASKTDEFSDETCRVNAASQYSVNGARDTSSSFKSKRRESLQNTASETSNIMSVSSNHDSLSENADSKASLRSSNDALDMQLLPLSSGGTTGEVGPSPKPLCNLYQGGSPNKHEDSKVLEVHDDDISCVSRANDANVAVGNSSRNIDRTNMSCSSASVSSLGPEESRKGHESIARDMPSKDADASSSSPKEKLFESSPEQIGASSKEVAAVDGASCQKSIACTSDVPMKFSPKLEAEVNNDGQGSTGGTPKCFGQAEQDEKSSKFDVREPPSQSMSGDESDESDIVEHDVKVCDICGDAGREDMLATCSRCSDGAEHTYCMRKMLRKVPGRNWMCEECKFAEEINTQKQEKEGKSTSKASLSTQLSSKRLAENIEAAPVAKRQSLETSIGSPKSSSPIRMAALSRESPFKNLDKERSRPAQPISVGNQSTNEMMETARSPVAGPRLHNKGTLFKSNSFSATNSKPKVKLVDEVVPQKQNGGKEYTSLDRKDKSARIIGKSMSFKSANSGRSSSSDSKVKMLSPRLALAIDTKGSKQAKERMAFERKSLSRLDRPPINSTTSSSVSTPKADQTSRVESSSFVSNNRELKVQSEGKSSTSKSTVNLSRKPVEIPITAAGVSSASGMCNTAIEHKSNPAVFKDEALSTDSFTTEKPSNNIDGTMQDGTRWQEIMHQTEKMKECSSRSRPTVTTSSRSTFCQKCKEIGHSADFCTISSSETSGIDASAARGSREETHRGSKLKDAIHAALLRKPEIQRKKRALDQSDEFSTSSRDLSSEITCLDQASNKSKIISPSEVTHEEPQSTLDSMHTTINNTMQHTAFTTNAKFSSKTGDLDALVSSTVKPVVKDLINHALATSPQLLKMSAIPEYEYIWRGTFEVHRSGSFFDLCAGIQAHLSTCASPRVPEVVCKFPHKLSLIEVPRLSAWPTQFCDGGAKEDNIALYFFAKDLESYERNYKSLLDGMIKNDLALKGNIEGVELLIFPSNQLPENSQRWNMLFFLWGVFRARRTHCSDSFKKLHIPSNIMTSVDKNASNTVMTSENLCSAKCLDTESHDERSCNAIVAPSADDQKFDGISGDCNDQKLSESLRPGLTANSAWHDSSCNSKCTSDMSLSEKMRCTSPSLQEKSPPVHGLPAELNSSSESAGANSDIGEKRQLHYDTSIGRKDLSSLKVLPYSSEDLDVRGIVSEEKIIDARVGVTESVTESFTESFRDNRASDENDKSRDQYKHERDLNPGGIERCQSTERKRPHIALSNGDSPASNVIARNIPWNGLNNMVVDGQNVGKKQKIGQGDMYGGSSYNCRTSLGGIEPKQTDVSPCLTVEEKICFKACEEKVILEDLGTTAERRFFPVDSRQGNISSTPPWKTLPAGGVDDDRLLDGSPNLELALGAETKKQQSKGILPFLVGLADKKNNQEKPLDKAVDDKQDDDDDSASLSLSLSFPPFPGNDEPVKPALKSEQLRPERHRVNTSLLLFGSLSDKYREDQT